MQVTVVYTAQVRVKAGMAEESLELADGANLSDALKVLRERGGELVSFLFEDDGSVRSTILIFIDGAQVTSLDYLLRQGSEITFLSPISGG